MLGGTIRFAACVVAFVVLLGSSAYAGLFSMPKSLRSANTRLALAAPIFEPIAHIAFCKDNPGECDVRRMAFRGGAVELTERRWSDLTEVNLSVNRAIAYEANQRGLAGEKWVIAPARGDCNDYAVTKRHQLIARGWPSRALLLAEVVVPSGAHHLVLVARTKAGDLLLDSLSPAVKPWASAPYRWIRMQTPAHPRQWAAVRPAAV